MLTIWKYQLKPAVTQMLDMPKGAKPLSVMCFQSPAGTDLVFMWAQVDPEARLVENVIHTFPTGSRIPERLSFEANFIGTYATTQNTEFWHVFHEEL